MFERCVRTGDRSVLWSRFTRTALIGAGLVLLMTSVGRAEVVIERVIAVPWQGDTAKFHTAIAGRETLLKGVIKTGSGGTIWYKWVYGDGSESSVGTLSGATRYNVESKHTYAAGTAVGTPFTARLLADGVDATMANAIQDTYLVKIEPDNLDARVNIAIDDGLWFLHKAPISNSAIKTFNGRPATVWQSYGNYFASPTACAVLAFQINNHKETGDPNEDPYVEDVKNGLNWLFNGYWSDTSHPMLQAVAIAPQAYGNPDDGNGIGIQVRDWDFSPAYEGGMIMDAIIASGTPYADCGRDFDGDGATETYKEVIQDMVDMYAWGQGDAASGSGAGGWRYNWNYGDSDNSACQWAAIGIIPAETDWGCTVPQWMKDRNNVWLTYSYNAANKMFGYTTGSNWGNNSSQATRPSGMVQMVMSVPDYKTDPRWTGPESWFATPGNWNWFMSNRSYYAWYAFAKAMRLSGTEVLSNGFNWYRGDNGLATKLVNEQESDRSWPAGGQTTHPGNYGDVFVTAWAIGMLRPALFAAAPVACFTAHPNPNYPDQPITFDPSCSSHSQAGKGIENLVLFEWDWDADGNYDEATPTPAAQVHSFACPTLPCTYPVTLRVTDDSVPPLQATYRMNISISNPPHPPVAKAGGPYWVSLCPEDSLRLDASESYDPNEGSHEAGCGACPNDTILAWDWDLTPPLTGFDDRSGKVVTLDSAAVASYFAAGIHAIGLRVTDNTAAAYPSSGQPNLTDANFSTVDVGAACACDLTIRSVCEDLVLSWSPAGTYDVYRSTAGCNAGFQKIGTASGNEFVDTDVTVGVTYSYRLRDGACMSACRSMAPVANGPPVIQRGPQPFSLNVRRNSTCSSANNRMTLTASDPEGQTLTWSIKAGGEPTKGTVTFLSGQTGTTLHLCYTPGEDLFGNDQFQIQVADPCNNRDSVTVQVVISLPPCHDPPQDADGDGDVDLEDFAWFQACFNGPDRPYSEASCICMDADEDEDCDMTDMAVFQICFNGASRPPTCYLTCHHPPQDSDGDGDVDIEDFAYFQACYNGPGQPYPVIECKCLDRDHDGDIDVEDFGLFQLVFNGAGHPPVEP